MYYTNAAGAVAAIITNTQGEILLTTRAFEPGKGLLICQVALLTRVSQLEQALHREISEELNIQIVSAQILFVSKRVCVYEFSLYHRSCI